MSRLLLVTMAVSVSVYQWYRLIGHKHLIPAQMLHIAAPWSPHPSHSYNPLLWQFRYFITTGVNHRSERFFLNKIRKKYIEIEKEVDRIYFCVDTFINVECIHCVFSPEWKINVCVIGKQRSYQSCRSHYPLLPQHIHEREWANKINQGIAFQPLFKPASIILPFK